MNFKRFTSMNEYLVFFSFKAPIEWRFFIF